MPNHNAYLARRQQRENARLSRQLAVYMQVGADAAAIAANDVFHMGPSRAAAFHEAYCNTYRKIIQEMNEDARDLEYVKYTLDKRLEQIFGENFVPYDIRYGQGGK